MGMERSRCRWVRSISVGRMGSEEGVKDDTKVSSGLGNWIGGCVIPQGGIIRFPAALSTDLIPCLFL